jgi:hypothetical protein
MKKERTKTLISKNQNELPAARKLEVSLDRADNVIEGGPAFDLEFPGGSSFAVFEGVGFKLSDPRIIRRFKIHTVAVSPPECSQLPAEAHFPSDSEQCVA